MGDDDSFGVIFDMDGVLVDSADAHFLSWQKLGEENGVSITRDQFAETFGQQNRDIVPKLIGDTEASRVDELSSRKEEIYRNIVRDDPPIVDGAVELVRDLHQSGARMAIGSSGPLANIELILDAMGVRDLMKAIVSGDDVSRGKPDPQVFSMAAERLALPPGRCIVIEDAPVGIEAARGAGAHCVAVLIHHDASAFTDASLTVARLNKLHANMIKGLLNES